MVVGSRRRMRDRVGYAPGRVDSTAADRTCRNHNGELTVSCPCEGLVLIRMVGTFDGEHCKVLLDFLQSIDGPERTFTTFHDLEGMINYDADVRVALTRWTLSRPKKPAALHFLVRSKIVSLGLEIANAALGGWLVSHRDRASFELAYEEALAAARRRPSNPGR